MTPIIKNINVVDEKGNSYEATYPKRAMGLVKKGRARFINENTICLACPPNIELEDIEMSENINNISCTNEEVVNTLSDKAEYSNQFTAADILQRLDELQRSQYSIDNVISQINSLAISERENESIVFEKISTISEIVKQREITTQKMVALYEKIYEDVTPSKPNPIERTLLALAKQLENPSADPDLLSDINETISDALFRLTTSKG